MRQNISWWPWSSSSLPTLSQLMSSGSWRDFSWSILHFYKSTLTKSAVNDFYVLYWTVDYLFVLQAQNWSGQINGQVPQQCGYSGEMYWNATHVLWNRCLKSTFFDISSKFVSTIIYFYQEILKSGNLTINSQRSNHSCEKKSKNKWMFNN